ncbi:site-specific integrase [Marinomonas shanghaiensis]|uniref:site-specific integrase n=1 Tax=Marinomonas shanghaiensis TaxID=2202418 RepID=UPI003A94B00E
MTDTNILPNLIEPYKSNEEAFNTPLINEIGSLQFTVYDTVKDKDFCFDLSHSAYESNEHIRRTISELFIMRVSQGLGWSNSSTQSLSRRMTTTKGIRQSLMRIGVWWAEYKPESKLSEWDQGDVARFIQDVLEFKVDWVSEESNGSHNVKSEGVASRGIIEGITYTLNQSEKLLLSGHIQDGLSFHFSEKQVKMIVRPILKSYQITYDDWKKGESYSSVPLPVAMLLLNDAIEVIRDTNTAFLMEYYQLQRSDLYYSVNSIFHQGIFQKFCDGFMQFEGQGSWPALQAKPKMEALLSLIHKYYGTSYNTFPMTNFEISTWCEKVYQAALVILLMLTGARISELASMKAGDLTYHLDGVWEFKSEIIKTNHGLSTIRGVHGLAAEAVQALEGLSYIDKLNQNEGVDIYLFGKFFTRGVKKKSFSFNSWVQKASLGTLSSMLKNFYAEFLEKHLVIKTIWPDVHPHQFRHTFAEFALRRFDGNVHEAIRRHFRHSRGSFMTNIYLSNKVDEAFVFAQEIMIQEISEQMINDARDLLNEKITEPRFHGAAMKAAIDLLDAKVISSEEELESVIDEFAEGFEKIVPHEYGYCMPRTKTISQSQCFDKVSKVAKLEEAGFSTCSSCVHSVQEINSHEASIVQIGLTHAQQMKSIEATTCFRLENNKQYQASKSAVINAERILKRMKSDKIIASSKE